MSTLAIVGLHGTMGSRVNALALMQPWISRIVGVTLTPLHDHEYASLEEITEPIDVIIDFSTPHQLESTLTYATKHHIPCVLAATGLTSFHEELIEKSSAQIPIFVSANLSLGVALLKQLLSDSLHFLGNDIDIDVVETHHTRKVDSPSGTAKMLASTISSITGKTMVTSYPESQLKDANTFGVHALRLGNVVGTHEIHLSLGDEIVTISHQALSRDIFAKGALRAAQYIVNQQSGIHTMDHLLKEKL
jgi:4-hydroxy-tetrahydrodipicolinate reductase